MLHLTVILEDLVIIANLHDGQLASVTVQDSPSGFQKTVECTCEEFGAAMALAIASDEIPGAPALYALAEPLCEKLQPTEEEMKSRDIKRDILRLIP